MKAFIIILGVLLLLGAAAFFVGWIQILIPAGTYAVIHTKTGGYEEQVVESGEFLWRVERLLPTNMKIYRFTIEPYQVAIPVIQGTLPSGDLYASAMEYTPDFSYKISLRATISLVPSELPRLVAEEELRPDELEQWMRGKGERIGVQVAGIIRSDPMRLNELGYQQTLSEQISRLSEFSGIRIHQITPVELRLPDPELYQLAKDTYFGLAAARQTRDLAAIDEEKSNLKVLREYGELLTEYPVLLEFLYLKELKGEGVEALEMEIPEIFKTAE
jgi:hypothetical protein